MHIRSSTRVRALASVSALALSTIQPVFAAPPPIAAAVVPPALVGRVARTNGSALTHSADATQWTAAAVNMPVSNGDAFWADTASRIDLQVASDRITLAPSTELDIASLDAAQFAASEPQGEVYLHLRQLFKGETYAVQTPRGSVQIAATGEYDIVAGDADHPTTVTVVDGAAQITGDNLSLQVGAHQTATITGATSFQGSVGPAAEDDFLKAMLAEDRPAPKPGVPAIVAGMTGCEDLYATGEWAQAPQYGAVWYPPVQAGWVPYRQGHWSYVAPWGWTWVDEAPWGFAPFHYGRWAEIDGRWGWIPVVQGAAPAVEAYEAPVYAPALVGFIAGAAAGALAAGAVGWVPLGPREPYYPPYRTNLAYVRALNAPVVPNVTQVINQTNIVNNRTVVQNFSNRTAVTVVPAAIMAQSRPVAGAVQAAPAGLERAAAAFRPPVTPGPATAGVTPAVARQFNFIAPPRAAGAPQGPAINPALLRAQPGRPQPLPPLRPVQAGPAPAAGAPAEPGRPAAGPGVPAVEPGRPAAEPVRPGGEPGRPAGEPGRPPAEPGRPAAEPGRPPAEPGRPAAEPGRPPAEPGRPAGEPGRPPGEPGRPAGEPGRPAAEPGRPAGEPNRPAAPAAPRAEAPVAPGRPPAAIARVPQPAPAVRAPVPAARPPAAPVAPRPAAPAFRPPPAAVARPAAPAFRPPAAPAFRPPEPRAPVAPAVRAPAPPVMRPQAAPRPPAAPPPAPHPGGRPEEHR